MTLQSTFYLVSIIFILSWLVFLLILIFMSIILFRKTNALHAKLQQKIDSPPAQFLVWFLPLLGLITPLISRFRKKA